MVWYEQAEAWPQRASAARTVSAIAESCSAALVPHAPPIMQQLLAELPGRIWNGKEDILAAVGTLSKCCAAAFVPSAAAGAEDAQRSVTDDAIVDTLMVAAARRNTAFATAAAEALATALKGWTGRDHLARILPLLECVKPADNAGTGVQSSSIHASVALKRVAAVHAELRRCA